MTIGEVLKSYRLHAGLSQKEMAAGVMSQSFYSKIESGIHNIDAELLVEVLTAHHFDVVKFFSQLSNQSTNEYNSFYDLESEITFAKNTKNVAKLQEVEKKIKAENKDIPEWLQFRIELAYAWITHSNDRISPELQDKLRNLIVDENWDRLSFYFLSQAVILLNIDDAKFLTNSAFEAFKKNPVTDPFTLQFVSWIAVNYLNCCYHEKVDKSYTTDAIAFLRSLPVTPEIGFSDILATYYEAVFNNDKKTASEVVDILKKGKYISLIQDTLEDK